MADKQLTPACSGSAGSARLQTRRVSACMTAALPPPTRGGSTTARQRSVRQVLMRAPPTRQCSFDLARSSGHGGPAAYCCLVAVLLAVSQPCFASGALRRFPPFLPCGADTPDLPRVIVNSHIAYELPLVQLLYSMVSVGFRDFCRVAVVIGGSPPAEPARLGNLTIVHTPFNSFDYTALDALHVYDGHPLLAAENYIYLHDTCIVHPQFVLFYSSLATTLAAQPQAFELFAASGYHSNILVFRRRFIKRVGRKYHRNFTKAEALHMELHHHVERIGRTFLNRNHPYISHIFGERVSAGDFDMYGTGFNRTLMYYPELGVYKLILMGMHGDIQGHVVGQGTSV